MQHRTLALVAAATLGLVSSSQAGLMILTYSPTLDTGTGKSTIGVNPLTAYSDFSMQAGFDTDGYVNYGVGVGAYPVTSFSISGNFNQAGYTTYTASSLAGIYVALFDQLYGENLGGYGAGILKGNPNNGLFSFFGTATPQFSANAPTTSILSNTKPTSLSSFSISLNDAGQTSVSLVLYGVSGDTTSAASLTAVPEPGNLLALSGLVLAGGFMRCRRHAAVSRNK